VDIKDADSTLDNIKYGNKNHQLQTNKTDHPKVWTHSLILILETNPLKKIKQATPSVVRWANLILQKSNKLPQAQLGLKPTSLCKGKSNKLPQAQLDLKAAPSLKRKLSKLPQAWPGLKQLNKLPQAWSSPMQTSFQHYKIKWQHHAHTP
jgi:hypothetical protein